MGSGLASSSAASRNATPASADLPSFNSALPMPSRPCRTHRTWRRTRRSRRCVDGVPRNHAARRRPCRGCSSPRRTRRRRIGGRLRVGVDGLVRVLELDQAVADLVVQQPHLAGCKRAARILQALRVGSQGAWKSLRAYAARACWNKSLFICFLRIFAESPRRLGFAIRRRSRSRRSRITSPTRSWPMTSMPSIVWPNTV